MKLSDLNSIYFACTGNTCRSPMAEKMFIDLIKENRFDLEVGSRRAQISIEPIVVDYKGYTSRLSRGTREILLHYGSDTRESPSKTEEFVECHVARNMLAEELDSVDLVATMTRSHMYALVDHDEAFTLDLMLKVRPLPTLVGFKGDVDDPIGPDPNRMTQVYISETGRNPKEEAEFFSITSGKTVDVYQVMVDYFGEERIFYEFEMPKYERTYTQLKRLLKELLTADFNLPTIQEFLKEELQERKRRWESKNLFSKRIFDGSWRFASEDIGDRTTALDYDRKKTFGNLLASQKLAGVIHQAAVKYAGAEEKNKVRHQTEKLNGAIMTIARNISEGKYIILNPNSIFSKQSEERLDLWKIGEELGKDLGNLAGLITATLNHAVLAQDRALACFLRRESLGMIEFAEEYCPKKQTSTIYHHLNTNC